MLWRNKKTGAVIDAASELRGAWEPAEPKKEPDKKAPKKGGKKK